MAKPEWGTKRRCVSCAAAFYDFRKDPIICPRCNTVHQPEQILKPRRTRPDDKAVVVPKPAPEPVDVDAVEETEEDAFIEDASELGEDEEDVVEVVESADEGEDTVDR
ncbi:TIGR02300 family protein [Desertibaculum subflavum]|uniref:TIGR02300 family protein n=1 Tax=Desertibaculum subflavum TaxID=2268458 RepID=UPI000E65EBE4